MKEKTSTLSLPGTEIVKAPPESVTVPTDEFLSRTVTPAISIPLASRTTPLTVSGRFWEKTGPTQKNENNTGIRNVIPERKSFSIT